MLILDFMKFRNMTYRISEYDLPDFLARLPARFCSTTVPWRHCHALHHIDPQRKKSVAVGPSRLGAISSCFRAHGEKGLLPVSDVCWMVHQNS